MTITVSVFNGISNLERYGAIQRLNSTSYQARNPFYVTLRSVAKASPFDITAGDFPLRARDFSGVFNGVGADEIATGNGYTKGGKALENVSFTYSAGVLTMKADDVKWTASGTGIAARSALLCYELPISRMFNSGSSNDPYTASAALAIIDFGGLLTASANLSFSIKWNAAGIFAWRLK